MVAKEQSSVKTKEVVTYMKGRKVTGLKPSPVRRMAQRKHKWLRSTRRGGLQKATYPGTFPMASCLSTALE